MVSRAVSGKLPPFDVHADYIYIYLCTRRAEFRVC